MKTADTGTHINSRKIQVEREVDQSDTMWKEWKSVVESVVERV